MSDGGQFHFRIGGDPLDKVAGQEALQSVSEYGSLRYDEMQDVLVLEGSGHVQSFDRIVSKLYETGLSFTGRIEAYIASSGHESHPLAVLNVDGFDKQYIQYDAQHSGPALTENVAQDLVEDCSDLSTLSKQLDRFFNPENVDVPAASKQLRTIRTALSV